MDAYDKGYGESPAEVPARRRSRSVILGISALFIGVVALASAALPMLLFERPTPGFREADDVIANEPESRFSFKWKNFKFTLGGPKQDEGEAARAEREANQIAAASARDADAQALLRYETRMRWLTVASAAFALFGLTIGPIAWARERHPALAGCAMAISGVALLWQYIVVGIVVGIVVVIVLAYFNTIGT